MVYIMRKELSSEMINNVYKALALIFNFADLTEDDVKNALEMQLKDFEDAVQIQTARRIGASIIITRNVKDFMKSPIPAYTPEEFLNRIDTEQS
jgi:predicted nucleic acid-binding protein